MVKRKSANHLQEENLLQGQALRLIILRRASMHLLLKALPISIPNRQKPRLPPGNMYTWQNPLQ
jgi:hypothetical protein